MRSCVVVVAYEAPMRPEQVRLEFVGFVERFNLANGCGPALTGRDMLNSQLLTLQCKLGRSASRRLKLSSLVSKYLFRNAIPFDGFSEQQ